MKQKLVAFLGGPAKFGVIPLGNSRTKKVRPAQMGPAPVANSILRRSGPVEKLLLQLLGRNRAKRELFFAAKYLDLAFLGHFTLDKGF